MDLTLLVGPPRRLVITTPGRAAFRAMSKASVAALAYEFHP
jgi:hypothetical protein